MLVNLISLFVLLALVVLLGWLTVRAWQAKRAWLKWPGVILAGLLTLLFALVTLVIGKGVYDLYRPYPVAAVAVSIAGTPEQLARGEYLASVLCASCHSTNGGLPLSGGNDFGRESGLPLGEMVPPNITPGGKIRDLSDADIYRILRTGVAPDGRLTAMSFFPVRYLSDDDAQSIIAFLRRQQPIEGSQPPFNPSPLLVAFTGLGFIKAEAAALPIQAVSAPPRAASAAYGQYVRNFMACADCHGPTLSGDAAPPAPPGPNLTAIVPKWSKDDFFKTMRTGVDPAGHPVQEPMPWKQIGKLDDVELEALYLHLHALTPISK